MLDGLRMWQCLLFPDAKNQICVIFIDKLFPLPSPDCSENDGQVYLSINLIPDPKKVHKTT